MDQLQPEDPRWIGPYWLEGRLGSGGMGRVYLGRSPGGRPVAIKVIRAELAEDAEFRARFAREVSTARKVSGIFTAPVVDADPDGPVPWLATSYVAGPSLADAVAERGPLPPASVLRLAAGLAEGLNAIHSAGVVHRDLKPSNVLLAEDGPRLIDFGICRSVATRGLTRTGMVVGSPGFMAPEQAEGNEVGPPSDVFSLGGVLTFAATGEGPFGEGSTPALLYRVVCAAPNTDRLPEEIRPLIERCLAKDPLHRPTAAQLLAELSTAQPGAYPLREPAIEGLSGHGPARPAPEEAARVMAPPHPDSPGSTGSGGKKGRFPRNAIIGALAIIVLALFGTVAALALTATSSTAAVDLEPVGTPGVKPFMPPVGTDQPGLKVPPKTGGTYSGGTPGLYGGTMRRASCNPQQLVSFLRVHPDKAAAWASVLGIQPADIPGYVAGLHVGGTALRHRRHQPRIHRRARHLLPGGAASRYRGPDRPLRPAGHQVLLRQPADQALGLHESHLHRQIVAVVLSHLSYLHPADNHHREWVYAGQPQHRHDVPPAARQQRQRR